MKAILKKQRTCTCGNKLRVVDLLDGTTKFKDERLFYYNCPKCKTTLVVKDKGMVTLDSIIGGAMLLIFLILWTLLFTSCGTETQFQGEHEISHQEPETTLLCQYDEDGDVLRQLEVEDKDVEFWIDGYGFEVCK